MTATAAPRKTAAKSKPAKRLAKPPATRTVLLRLPGKLVCALDGSAQANHRSRNAEATVLLTRVLDSGTGGA